MAKTPTSWNLNPAATVNERVYDSSSVAYDSSSLTFDGIVAGQSLITTKVATDWTKSGKNDTAWIVNTAANVSGAYDTTDQYDATTSNYDDVTAGESYITNKVATNWTAT